MPLGQTHKLIISNPHIFDQLVGRSGSSLHDLMTQCITKTDPTTRTPINYGIHHVVGNGVVMNGPARSCSVTIVMNPGVTLGDKTKGLFFEQLTARLGAAGGRIPSHRESVAIAAAKAKQAEKAKLKTKQKLLVKK